MWLHVKLCIISLKMSLMWRSWIYLSELSIEQLMSRFSQTRHRSRQSTLTLACEPAQRDCVSSEKGEQSGHWSQSHVILFSISIYTCQECHITMYAHRLRMQDRSIQQTYNTRKECKYLQKTSFLVVEIKNKSLCLHNCKKCNSFSWEMGLIPFRTFNTIRGQQLSSLLICLNNSMKSWSTFSLPNMHRCCSFMNFTTHTHTHIIHKQIHISYTDTHTIHIHIQYTYIYHTHTHNQSYTYTYTFTFTFTYQSYTYTFTFTHTHTYTHTHTHHTHTHTHTHSHTHTHTHTHFIHKHIYIHIHIQAHT